MNETELDELIATLSGIRDGKPWEFAITSSDRAQWHAPDPDLTWKRCLELKYRIRLKPWTLGREVNGHVLPEGREWFKGSKFTEEDLPPPYRPLMVGEDPNDEAEIWSFGTGPWQTPTTRRFSESLNPVRTKRPIAKPEPARVPLGPEDVPPGSVLRSKEWTYGGHVTPSVFLRVVCWINTTGPIYLAYEDLMRGWEILRPGQTWQPCWKEVKQ